MWIRAISSCIEFSANVFDILHKEVPDVIC